MAIDRSPATTLSHLFFFPQQSLKNTLTLCRECVATFLTRGDLWISWVPVSCDSSTCHLASSPGSLHVSHWRAWYFFSRDLTYIIARLQDCSKDCCTSLPFAGDSVSALSLWYKQALKSSYKKCRCAAFLRF